MMQTQEKIAEKFQRLQARSGYSWREISEFCGYTHQSAIQRYYTPGGNSKPYLPPKMIDSLLKHMVGKGQPPITEADIMELAPLLGFQPDYSYPTESPKNPKVGLASAPYSGAWAGNDKIPVLAYAAASGEKNAINLENDVPIRWVDRPVCLIGVVKAAAVQLMGDSMTPRYRDGELAYVNLSAPPQKNRDAIIITKDGFSHLKEYIGQDKEYVYLHQWNPDKQIKVHKRDIESMYAVVGRD